MVARVEIFIDAGPVLDAQDCPNEVEVEQDLRVAADLGIEMPSHPFDRGEPGRYNHDRGRLMYGLDLLYRDIYGDRWLIQYQPVTDKESRISAVNPNEQLPSGAIFKVQEPDDWLDPVPARRPRRKPAPWLEGAGFVIWLYRKGFRRWALLGSNQ
jgi:hypothetical protein